MLGEAVKTASCPAKPWRLGLVGDGTRSVSSPMIRERKGATTELVEADTLTVDHIVGLQRALLRPASN